MVEARGYIRVSTRGSKDRGTHKAQLSDLRKYADKEGYKLVDVYRDLAISGTMKLEDRDEGSKLLADIKPGEKIIAVHFDRLTREDSREDWFRVFELLKARKVPFDPVEGSEIDPTDENADISWLLEGKKARHEYERLVKRFNSGRKEAKINRGHHAEGGIPFGVFYHNIETDDLGNVTPVKKYKKHPDEFKVLKEFFQLVKRGYALGTIAEMFNSEGIPTKYGKKWAGTTLNQILKNDFYYTGILFHKVETFWDDDGNKTTVKLAEKDWIRIDTNVRLFPKGEILEVRKHRKAHPATKRKITKNGNYEPGTYLLRGLMFCECGRVMSPFKASVGYYRCKRKGCRTNGLNMRKTDRGVWDAFENKLTDSELIHGVLKAENLIPGGNVKEAMKRKKVAEAKLIEIKQGKDRLVEQFTLHRVSKNRYEELMVELEKNETHYRREKEKAENTTHDSDAMKSEANMVANFFTDKMKAFHELEKVKMSLADADMATRLKFTPRLIEILKDLKMAVSKADLGDPTKVKDFLFEYKRNLLKEAILLGVKITSHKDGSVAVTMLPSDISAQGRFG